MRQISIKQLAELMQLRKKAGESPFLLFLGPGVSMSSGFFTFNQIVERFLIDSGAVNNKQLNNLDQRTRSELFASKIENLNKYDRYTWLTEAARYNIPSVGFDELTRLIEEEYFDIILTTNWDSFLDRSLESSIKLRNRSDYRFYVRGVDRDDYVVRSFNEFSTPRVKILKLQGELESWSIFTGVGGAEALGSEFSYLLKNLFSNRDLIVLGYSLSDLDFRRLFHISDRRICIIANPNIGHQFDEYINVGNVRLISGDQANFDKLMSNLSKELLHDKKTYAVFEQLDKRNRIEIEYSGKTLDAYSFGIFQIRMQDIVDKVARILLLQHELPKKLLNTPSAPQRLIKVDFQNLRIGSLTEELTFAVTAALVNPDVRAVLQNLAANVIWAIGSCGFRDIKTNWSEVPSVVSSYQQNANTIDIGPNLRDVIMAIAENNNDNVSEIKFKHRLEQQETMEVTIKIR